MEHIFNDSATDAPHECRCPTKSCRTPIGKLRAFWCRVVGHDDRISGFTHTERGWTGRTLVCRRCHLERYQDSHLGDGRLPTTWRS
jgi:hypothetical protein